MTSLLKPFYGRDTTHRVARFIVVGALGTLVDFCMFALLRILFGVPTLLANTLSYGAGIVNNYFFHRLWTFADRPQQASLKQMTHFTMVSLSALAANNLIVILLAPKLGDWFTDTSLGAVLAKACAIGVGMIWNFLANQFWTFRPVAKEPRTK